MISEHMKVASVYPDNEHIGYLDIKLIDKYLEVTTLLTHLIGKEKCSEYCHCDQYAVARLAGYLWDCYRHGVPPYDISDEMNKRIDEHRSELSKELLNIVDGEQE